MTIITPEIQKRIDDHEQEVTERLSRTAAHLLTAPDHVTPGAFLVHKPPTPGTVEIVTADGRCSCQRLRVRGRGKHQPWSRSGMEASIRESRRSS